MVQRVKDDKVRVKNCSQEISSREVNVSGGVLVIIVSVVKLGVCEGGGGRPVLPAVGIPGVSQLVQGCSGFFVLGFLSWCLITFPRYQCKG